MTGLRGLAAVRKRVLILEDDAGVATLERRTLERAGYDVLTAHNAAEASEMMATSELDTLLVDYGLPGGQTGLDFYVRVRDSGSVVPVIIVTGLGDQTTVIRALREGVRDYILKSPEFLTYLPDAVDRVLRQVETERQLAESEGRLAAVIGSSRDAILTLDREKHVRSFNLAAEKMFGCPAAEAIGMPLARFLPGAFNGKELKARWSGELPSELSVPSQITGLRANGESFPLEAIFSDAEAAGQRFYTVFLRDITQRLALEEQLRQSQKMEAIGALAGGIAHDFNNLLTAIIGFSEFLATRVQADERAASDVAEIRRAADRAAGLTRQLLAFSRKQVLAPIVLDMNAVVREMEKMLRRLIGENIRLDTNLAPALGKTKADPGQMEQVLLNLAVNARDAMPSGGRLFIETANADLDRAAAVTTPDAQPGEWVTFAIHDTGQGMDAATRSRIFEPFFTTKEKGKGTGLGLSTVYGIVRQSGGFIVVESVPGRGSTFRIYLPRFAAER